MSADVIQFVDRITADPAVLLDLNNDGAPFATTLFSAVPPPLRRAMGGTMLLDGDIEFASARADRVLELTVDLMAEDQNAKAAGLQALARVMDRPRWLRYQPNGAPKPVFFRTRRGDITQLASIDVTAAKVELQLSLPAEPFAYGLPETDTVIVANDAAASTNPLGFEFPPIKGDAPAPLRLGMVRSGAGSSSPTKAIIVNRAGDGSVGPVVLQSFSYASSGSSYSMSTESDSDAYGGAYSRFIQTAGIGPATITASGPVRRGDYRLIVRGKTGQMSLSPEGPWITVNPDGDFFNGVDLGVVRLPRGAALLDPRFDTSQASDADVRFYINGHAELDAVILVPVGLDLDQATSTVLTRTLSQSSVLDSERARFDGFVLPEGGPVLVVPGSVNNLALILGLRPVAGAPITSANRSWTTQVTWTYYPRYLSLRSELQ